MADIPRTDEEMQTETLHVDGTDYETMYTRKFRRRPPWRPDDRTVITTQIPGLILEVLVKPGQRVERGQGVVVLEAMKMANEVESPWSGVVERIAVEVGQNVPKGEMLVKLA